jgi:uncharacterized protein (DUF1499 family)
MRLWRGADPAKPSKLAWTAFALAAASGAAAFGAGQAHRFGWMAYALGFAVLRWAAYAALSAIVLAIVALARSATGARRRGWGPALIGLLVALGWLAVPSYYVFMLLPRAPRIHDITTDTDRPPAFVAIVPLRAGFPNPAAYDGPEVAALQKQGYPDLAPLMIAKPPAAVFPAALEAVQALGMEVVNATEKDGRIEASARSLFFGFVDDMVIRLQADGAGTRVDVRSKSRDGRSDFGMNAARVRKVLDAIKARTAG